MSANLILAVMHDEWVKRRGFPLADQAEIADVIQQRVRAICGGAEPAPTAPISHATTRAFAPVGSVSWYEREPGEDDQ
jgi:hypothetical protein